VKKDLSIKIAWGITGAGDYLPETINIMKTLQKKYNLDVTVVLSKNGELVSRWYHLWDDLRQNFKKVLVEKDANSPFLAGSLQLGKYAFFLVCPASANTTAKIAHGIADSLISNCVAQAMKGGCPTYIYPTDQKLGSLTTLLPNGKKLTVTTRDVDVENVERLKRMKDIYVLSNPKEIEKIVQDSLQKKGTT
jgi:archaeoflavoprotein AfpA